LEKCVTTERARESSASHTSLVAATQSDRARLIYSASFRRLQQKAQVFSLEDNSAVRSRLTHSIEVSHIGRYIVTSITEKINNSDLSKEIKDYWINNSLALSNIVETACLMHDIGNPPFGHFGEAAISTWAEERAKEVMTKSSENIADSAIQDFIFFDGNPQGLRTITKLQGDDGFYGLNLTFTQIAAFLKYTYSPSTRKNHEEKPFSKKIGLFDTESDLLKEAWEKLGMQEHSRHPLGFLMEASDDISYCISDIEDGIEKGVISLEHFEKSIIGELEEQEDTSTECIYKILIEKLGNSTTTSSFLNFKTTLSNFLVDKASANFVRNYNDYINSECINDLIAQDSVEYKLLKILKNYTNENIFSSQEAECKELSGFAIISGILQCFEKLLELPKDKFSHLLIGKEKEIKKHKLFIHRRLFNRLPEKHLNAYKAALIEQSILNCDKSKLNEDLQSAFNKVELDKEWNLRTHLVIDFISGMTDQFAMEFYQLITGINVKF